MGNLLDKCHKSRHLPELEESSQRLGAFGDQYPHFLKEHQISLKSLHGMKPRQNEYKTAFDEIIDNTITFHDKYAYLQDLQGWAEKSLKALIKKDRLHKWKALKQVDICLYERFAGSFLAALADFIIIRLPHIKGIKVVLNQ